MSATARPFEPPPEPTPRPKLVRDEPATPKLPLMTLAAMVVGSMVGAGVFSLPRNFAQATGVFGALIAWAIAGVGMLMLAFVFQTLAVRKPELDAGVYAYAKAGFGNYPGFFSAFGYWASACVGNVTYWVLIKSTLGAAIPAFGEGNTIIAVVLSSIGVWAFHFLILRGVKQAAGINKIVTIAKIIPLLVFLVIAAFALKGDVLRANLWGGEARTFGALFGQVKATMLITVFVFLGIEGATVYSRYARRREDVGTATVLGFLGVLALFSLVTILSYGVLPRAELADLRQPSVAGVLQSIVGTWGLVFISVGLIVSVLGAYLAWTLMAAEVAFAAAKNDDMPEFLKRTNRNDVPAAALLMSTGLIQLVLLVTLFSEDAFTFTLKLCSALNLVPYLFAAGYALKLGVTRETYDRDPSARGRQTLVAGVATFYTAFLLFAAGLKFLLLSFIIYVPGTILFFIARREQGKRVFTPAEVLLFTVAIVGAIAGVVARRDGSRYRDWSWIPSPPIAQRHVRHEPFHRRPDVRRPAAADARRRTHHRIEVRLTHVEQILEVRDDLHPSELAHGDRHDIEIRLRPRPIRIVVERLSVIPDALDAAAIDALALEHQITTDVLARNEWNVLAHAGHRVRAASLRVAVGPEELAAVETPDRRRLDAGHARIAARIA